MGGIIPLSIPNMDGKEKEYLCECIESGWVSTAGGRFLQDFEKSFTEYTGCAYSNAVINGTAAIHIALKTLGVGEGDEVIIPSLTFISTASAVKYTGADIVFVDVCQDNYCMDVEEVKKAITPKTKAIIPVHLYGNMVDMKSIMKVAKENGIYVVEDATEGLGSFQDGIMAGNFGDIGCYSFNGNKLVTTGAGGMICCGEEEINERIDYLKNQAKTIMEDKSTIHHEIGFNYRMPNILAAIGLAQMEKIDEKVQKKKEIEQEYLKGLGEVAGISFPSKKEGEDICPWLSAIVIEEGKEARDRLISELGKEGMICRPFFYPLHLMEPFAGEKVCGNMENTLYLGERGINIPSSLEIKKDEIKKVCDKIKSNMTL